MQSKFLPTHETYDGSQLVSLRSYLKHGLLGDSIVSWVGPCNVSDEHMVDGEDLRAHAAIRGDSMLHFIVEKFEVSLFTAVALQRLLAATVQSEIGHGLIRRGDDLYLDERKLSISVATQSPTSSLIHFAVNVTNAGTPVKTLSLGDFGLEPERVAEAVMRTFCAEIISMREASQKVKWVK